jgi:hypothetical protein
VNDVDSKPQQDPRAFYVREVLRLYRSTPGVHGHVRRADHDLAARLFDQGVPLYAVANAFLVGAARRVLHNGFSTPMPPVRSLHYFVALIHEMLERPLGYRDLDQLRHKLQAALRR